MKNYFKPIEDKIKREIIIESIEIVDNSHLHKNHKFFSSDKFHLCLNIKSKYLKSISKISAHKMIMKVLRNDLRDKIHALEINIEP